MSEHTAGKLRFERRYSNGCEVCPEIFADNGRWIGGVHGSPHLGHKDTIPNARRLVASWNLCDGIPTDQIEAAPNLGRLIVEHGEMLAALKGIRDNYDCECAQRCDGPHDDCPCSYCFGCRVIAKVEAPCQPT